MSVIYDQKGNPMEIGMTIPKYDYVSKEDQGGDREVYTFKSGGANGTTVSTITIQYTDGNKDEIKTVTQVDA